MLVAAEDEQLVLDDGAGAVDRDIFQGQVRLGLAEGKERGPGIRIHGPTDVVELGVRVVRAGIGDDVENVAGRAAKFRRIAIGYRLDLADIDIGDWEKTQPVPVALGVHHPVHLVVDPVQQPVGVDRARDPQFGVGVAADAGLEDDEIVRVAGCERQVVNLLVGDRTARFELRRLQNRGAAGDFH